MVERPDFSLGANSERLDDQGRIEIQGLPEGIRHVVTIDATHPRLGAVAVNAELPADTDHATIHVNGAGMLVVRFFDAQGTPLSVVDPQIHWTDKSPGYVVADGRKLDVRLPMAVGRVLDLEVDGSGLERVRVTGVRMLSDGPTIVDVKFPGK
jgi:hypothetical protein